MSLSAISRTNLYYNDLRALVLWRCPLIAALMLFFFFSSFSSSN